MQEQKNLTVIDANVILRYFLKDNEKFYSQAENFFKNVFSGKTKIYILQSVIAEVIYVGIKLYKIERKKLANVLYNFLLNKNIKVQDKDITLISLKIFEENNLDFVDCLLCAYGEKYNIFSFDSKVLKFISKEDLQ